MALPEVLSGKTARREMQSEGRTTWVRAQAKGSLQTSRSALMATTTDAGAANGGAMLNLLLDPTFDGSISMAAS